MTDPKRVDDNEEQWVARSRAGDVEAFEQLVRLHQRGVYAFCRRLTGSHDEADDVAQEAFVRAYRSIDRFRGESRFGTWLRQIALNLVRSGARRRRLLRTTPLDPDTLPDDAAAGAGSERSLEAHDPFRSKRLRDAVRELPDKQRQTLVLKMYEEMTHSEVARLMGCTVGTVKANLFHALRRLRRTMGGQP